MSNTIEKILECPICLETYKSPKVLPCQHSFCLACIYQLYLEKQRTAQKFVCPLCNRELDFKMAAKSKKSNTILTLDEFKSRLADNLTLIELNDAFMKPKTTPSQNLYKNECMNTNHTASTIDKNKDSLTKNPAVFSADSRPSIDKPQPLPRIRKPPPPDPPISITSKVQSRLSIIPEEKPPPAHPLRRLPTNEIKTLLKLESDLSNVVTTNKILLNSTLNIFISFVEDSAGIRKYDGTSGQFLMKFAGTGVIVDFALDQKSAEIVCIVRNDVNQTYLQSYDPDNGQRLKCLRYFTSLENFKLITSNKQNKNEYILAGQQQIASYNSKQNVVKAISTLLNLPSLNNLSAIDCSKSGTLYLLFSDQAQNSPIIFGLSLTASITFSLPIYSDDFSSYKSFSITANNYYVCDSDSRCVRTYRKIKPGIKKVDTQICKSNYYNWRPELVFAVEKKIFVYDSEKKAIFTFDDKEAI